MSQIQRLKYETEKGAELTSYSNGPPTTHNFLHLKCPKTHVIFLIPNSYSNVDVLNILFLFYSLAIVLEIFFGKIGLENFLDP